MAPQQPAVPQLKAAFDHPPTARGHRRLVVKRRIWLALIVATGVGWTWMGVAHPPRNVIGMIVISVLFYPLLLTVTYLALRRTRRNAAILRTYPWRAFPCEYPRRSLESPKVVVINFTDDHAPVLRFTPFSVNLREKQNPQPDMIWFAGDIRYGGVVSPVGGHFPVRVVPDAPAAPVPAGTAGEDELARVAELVKDGKVRTT
ncbi:hypothetical protein ACF08N_01035 [Streptomyces sp. NPDC015127]|uniref:hypothetical protein n=1 Tax=Streptomyces sp. NPDC015127 TaxID=3364939 RepID=UPI0037004D3A